MPTKTPAMAATEYGLTLADVARMTKQSRQTLANWQKNKPELFTVVLEGCAAMGGKGK